MDFETKKALFILLYKVAKSDNEMHPKERQFIQELMLQFPEVDFSNVSEEVILPTDEADRMYLFYHLLFMMKSDGKIDVKEANLVTKFGLELGFRPEMIQKFIELFANHLDDKIPQDKMLKIVKTYLN